MVIWSPRLDEVLNFNVDGATRGKLGPAGIRGVLRNNKGEVIFLFTRNVGMKESNEAEVLAILQALQIFSSSFQGRLIVESDSSNAISWVTSQSVRSWQFHFLFMEI